MILDLSKQVKPEPMLGIQLIKRAIGEGQGNLNKATAESTYNKSLFAEMAVMNLRLKEHTMLPTNIGSSLSNIHNCKALTKRVTVKKKRKIHFKV